MTPLVKTGTEIGGSVLVEAEMEDLNNFSLEGPVEENLTTKHKKIRKDKIRSRPRLFSTWHFVDD